MYTVEKAKQEVKNAIHGYLYKNAEGAYVMKERNRLPIYLEGAPGIGKTELVEQVAKELGIGFVSFSLVHHTRNSLLGLPVIESLQNGDKYTTYTMSEIIAKVQEQTEAGCTEGILLLDEFPCMSETIVPVMLAFLQTKNIGEHRLPEGWVIVLCGNPPKYNKSARKFDSAVLDRLRKISVEFDANCFVEYGRKIGLEEMVLTYLELVPGHAYRCEERNGEKELVTCRGWENLSHTIRIYRELGQEMDFDCVRQFIKSEEVCHRFMDYEKQYSIGLSKEEMEDILLGRQYQKHKERVKGLSMRQKLLLAGYLCSLMERKGEQKENLRDAYPEVADCLSNVFDLMNDVDPTGILAEKVFSCVNNSELLVRTVCSVKVPQYLAMTEGMDQKSENVFMVAAQESRENVS